MTMHSTAWPARSADTAGATSSLRCQHGTHLCQRAPASPLLSHAHLTASPRALPACPWLQYGHLLNSKFSDSEWGVYLKGGSGGQLY